MQPKKHLKWFTLIEIIISVVIIAMLIGLIFQIFVTIGRIAVYIQLHRSVHNEMIYATQTIQNMVDDQTMELTGYNLGTWGDEATAWWKEVLQMSDDSYRYQIEKLCTYTTTWCYLQLSRIELGTFVFPDVAETGAVALTNYLLTDIHSFEVRTLPYTDPATDYLHLLHEGFWLFIDMRVPQYDTTKWRFRVNQNLQLFFTMRKYE